jgi:hypothetical protein
MVSPARFAIALCCAVIAQSGALHAEPSKLEAARKSIEEVRYDEAAVLLREALEAGGNSPAAVTEIYQLSATTATVLRDHEGAKKLYRRWLALDPRASLSSDAAEKFRAPFIDAQAFVKANGSFRVRVGKRDNNAVEIVIDSDPLKLAATASLDDRDPAARTAFGVDGRLILPVAAGAGMVRVYVYDRYGNHLVERAFATFSQVSSDYVLVRDTPVYREWRAWTVAALAVAGAGLYFGREADRAQDQLDEIESSRGASYFYSDVTEAIDRRDRSARIANGLFIGAAGLAAAAIVMYVVRPPKRWLFAPKVEGAPGVTAIATF